MSHHERLLHDLLSALHNDGGKHTYKVGVEQSVKEAIEKFKILQGHSDALAIARTDLAQLKLQLREFREEYEDQDRVMDRMRDLLVRTANALHGGPMPNGSWSWHDLPELATALRESAHEEALKKIKSA